MGDDIRYYHDLHCSANPFQPMGNEGCSCTMYQRARRAERALELKTPSEEPDQDQLWDELKETVHNASLHSYISRVAMDRLKGKYTITRK